MSSAFITITLKAVSLKWVSLTVITYKTLYAIKIMSFQFCCFSTIISCISGVQLPFLAVYIATVNVLMN